eukprot:gene9301-12532_t
MIFQLIILLITACCSTKVAALKSVGLEQNDVSFFKIGNENCKWQEVNDLHQIAFNRKIDSCLLQLRSFSEARPSPNHWWLYCYVAEVNDDTIRKTDQPRNATSSQLLSFPDMINILKNKIQHKTFKFFGDSISRQQAAMLACLYDANSASNITNWKKVPINVNDETVNVYRINLRNSTSIQLTVLGPGASPSAKYGSTFRSVIYNIFDTAKSNDVIVLNQGVHYNSVNKSYVKFSLKYDYTISSVTHVTAGIYEEFMLKNINTSIKSAQVIWRESTPQSFGTSDGNWDRAICVRNSSIICNCTLFSPLVRELANKRNYITNPIIRRAHMNISYVYKALSNAPFKIHLTDVDCTHFRRDALAFMSRSLLSLLFFD